MATVPSYTSAAGTIGLGSTIFPYAFVYPNVGTAPFFVGFGIDKVSSADDSMVLKSLLKGAAGAPILKAEDLPEGLPTGMRFYDVSSCIPDYVRRKLGSSEAVPGPNCYHAVMSVCMGPQFEGRYVHDDEIEYFLTRDFTASAERNIFGGALIFSRSYASAGRRGFVGLMDIERGAMRLVGHGPTGVRQRPGKSTIPVRIGTSHAHGCFRGRMRREIEQGSKGPGSIMGFAAGAAATLLLPAQRIIPGIDHGEHGAIMLLGGMAFQKGCYGTFCSYKIVPAARAMSSIEVERPRWGQPPRPEKDENFSIRCYVRTERDYAKAFGFNMKLSHEMERYLPIMDYYIARLRAVKDRSWGDFKASRIDLLTVENMWTLLNEMEGAMRAEPNPLNALLRIEARVAEKYLELLSLKWQYQAMVEKFAAFSDRWDDNRIREELKRLYREHYVHPDSPEFEAEVRVQLEARGVDSARWPSIIQAVISKVKEYDSESFAQYDGSKGIPFREIIDAAIGK